MNISSPAYNAIIRETCISLFGKCLVEQSRLLAEGLIPRSLGRNLGQGLALGFIPVIKKSYLYFPLFFFILSFTVQAQYRQSWIKGFGNSISDYPVSMAIDQDGNSYITGSFQDVLDLDPNAGISNITSKGADDVYVVKYDASGNFVWGFGMGTTGKDGGNAIMVDDAGGAVYVTGLLGGLFGIPPPWGSAGDGIMDIDPSMATSNLQVTNPQAANETFIAKYDLNGNLISGISFKSLGKDIASANYSQSISKMVNGEFLVGGYFVDSVDFDPGAGVKIYSSTGTSSGDMYFAKLDQNFNLIWAQGFGGTDNEYLRSVEQLNDGSLYICGSYKGTIDFDPSPGGTNNLVSTGSGTDIFIAHYDASGNHVWAHTFGGGGSQTDDGYSITPDLNGDATVSGCYYGTVDFDPGVGNFPMTSTSVRSGFFGKYSKANGSLIWVKNITHTFSGADIGLRSITVNSQDEIFVWGNISGAGTGLDIDPNAGQYKLKGCGDFQFFGQYDNNGNFICGNNICPSVGGSLTYMKDKIIRIYKDETVYMAGAYTASSVRANCNTSVTLPFAGNSDVFITRFDTYPTIAVIAGNDTVCKGSTLPLTASGGSTYTWSTGETTALINPGPTTVTNYSVVVDDSCACSYPDTAYHTLQVVETPLALILGPDSICEGSATTLSYAGAGAVLWSTGETVNTITVTPVSTAQYTLTVNNECGRDTADFSLKVVPPPVLQIGGDTIICLGESTTLTAQGSNVFLWSNGQSTSSITVTPGSDTWYYVNGGGFCPDAEDGVQVKVNALPVVFVSNDTLIQQGDSAQLKVTGGISLIWSPSQGLGCDTCPNTKASPEQTTVFCAVVTDANGCTNTDCINVEVQLICLDLFIPNAFSPNGDGQNEEYRIFGNCIDKLTFVVYDRWGVKVFETTDPTFTWDGKFNGEYLSTQVLVYTLKLNLVTGGELNQEGSISIVR